MSLTTLINRPCLLLLRSPSNDSDKYGSEKPDETLVETVCEIQQSRRTEPDDAGELGVTTWDVFFLADSEAVDATTGDAVVVGGHTYEFVGPSWVARNPRTQAESHVEATAKRVAGAEEVGS